jgi:hypothetical protein
MIHDFEEIIFFKWWLSRNGDLLQKRFPKLAARILPHIQNLSTAGFALAVAEEFIIISAITLTAMWTSYYFLWLAAFGAFSIHLVLHIIQWIIYGCYIPSIITSLLILPYSIYTFMRIVQQNAFSIAEIAIWTIIGIIVMLVNVIFAHRLAVRFDRWANMRKTKANSAHTKV